mgnify:FL=1
MVRESPKSSFERINYYLRPNKQVERKLMIEMLQQIRRELDISSYCYLGMGSIYYYDYILFHKMLSIDDMISIDNKTAIKRFDFNKPYEFIKFHNCITTDYLRMHDWQKKKTITWLDYDTTFGKGEPCIIADLKILGINCGKNDILFVSINSTSPEDSKGKDFLEKYKTYISPPFKILRFTRPKYFPELLQNIVLNVLKEGCEYNKFKFYKMCSFTYKDGAPMYTIGGIFTDDAEFPQKLASLHDIISLDTAQIHKINIPNITYKEKFYMDSKINSLRQWFEDSEKEVDKLGLDDEEEKKERIANLLYNKMDIELSPDDVKNYLAYYKYFPQYYEGII